MDEIVEDFKSESKALIADLMNILEDLEGDFTKVQGLEKYGQVVDRIMGGATTVSMAVDDPVEIDRIAKFAELCKKVGYRGSQIEKNEDFFHIVVALLMDATETMESVVDCLGKERKSWNDFLSDTFLDRLKWVNSHFNENTRASVQVGTGDDAMAQDDINDLLKSLGI